MPMPKHLIIKILLSQNMCKYTWNTFNLNTPKSRTTFSSHVETMSHLITQILNKKDNSGWKKASHITTLSELTLCFGSLFQTIIVNSLKIW